MIQPPQRTCEGIINLIVTIIMYKKNSTEQFLMWGGAAFFTLILITLFAKCIGQQPESGIWIKTGKYEFASPAKREEMVYLRN